MTAEEKTYVYFMPILYSGIQQATCMLSTNIGQGRFRAVCAKLTRRNLQDRSDYEVA